MIVTARCHRELLLLDIALPKIELNSSNTQRVIEVTWHLKHFIPLRGRCKQPCS